MKRYLSDAAVRRGAYDGLIVAAVIAAVAFLTVVVFAPGPDETDDDPEYLVQLLVAYVLLFIALMAIGAHARRRSDSPYAGLKAGAAAGFVIASMVTLTYLLINNAFFPIVSQQHDKRVAFAASGWSSMRAFINFQTLSGLVVVVPMATARRCRARLPRRHTAGAAPPAQGGPAVMRSRAAATPPRHHPIASTHQVRPDSA